VKFKIDLPLNLISLYKLPKKRIIKAQMVQ
jgi:hypothetical protein